MTPEQRFQLLLSTYNTVSRETDARSFWTWIIAATRYIETGETPKLITENETK